MMNENNVVDTTDFRICEITKILACFFDSVRPSPIKGVQTPFRVYLDDGKDFEFVSPTFFYQFFCDQNSDLDVKVRGPNAFVEKLPLWKIVERASKYFYDTVSYFQNPTCTFEEMFYHVLHLVHFFKMDEEVFLTSIVIFNRYVSITRSYLNISLSNLFYLLILCILLAFKSMFDIPVNIRSVAQALNLNLSTITNNEVQILNALKYNLFYNYGDLEGLGNVFPLEGLMYLSFASRATLTCPKEWESMLMQEREKVHSSSVSTIYSFHKVLSGSRTVSPLPSLSSYDCFNGKNKNTSTCINVNRQKSVSCNSDTNSNANSNSATPSPTHSTSPNTSPLANTSSGRKTAGSLPPPLTPTTCSSSSSSTPSSSSSSCPPPPVLYGYHSLENENEKERQNEHKSEMEKGMEKEMVGDRVGSGLGVEGGSVNSDIGDEGNVGNCCESAEQQQTRLIVEEDEAIQQQEEGQDNNNENCKQPCVTALLYVPAVIKGYVDFRLWLDDKVNNNDDNNNSSCNNNGSSNNCSINPSFCGDKSNNPIFVLEYFDDVEKVRQGCETQKLKEIPAPLAPLEREMCCNKGGVECQRQVGGSSGKGSGGGDRGGGEWCKGTGNGMMNSNGYGGGDGGGEGNGTCVQSAVMGVVDADCGFVVGSSRGVVSSSSSSSNPLSPITPAIAVAAAHAKSSSPTSSTTSACCASLSSSFSVSPPPLSLSPSSP